LRHDLGIGAGLRGGAGWGRSRTHMIVQVVHEVNLSPPCTAIKERRASHLCWHRGVALRNDTAIR
jgi:hypothetical protein